MKYRLVPITFAIALGFAAVASTATLGAQAGDATHVRPSAISYRLMWSKQLDNIADSTAIVNPNISLPGGKTANYAYVLAGNNGNDCDPSDPAGIATTYAFNLTTGKLIWHKSTKGLGRCTTAAPAVTNKWVYSPGLDGRIHRYNAATGHEWTKGGWPKRFTKQTYVEKSSSNLIISGQYLHLATSGFVGDQGHYEGHVVTIDLKTGHEFVWNSLCSNIHTLITDNVGSSSYCSFEQNGMFGRGQDAVDPLNGDFYVVTGNGPWNGKTNWGDSVLKLNPNGTKLLDAFTPTDQQYLNDQDLDLGSTGPAILPPIMDGGKTYHLLLQGGKGGAINGGPAVVWLVNRDRMGLMPGPGSLGGSLDHATSPGGTEVLTKPAVWINSQGQPIVIYCNDSGTVAYDIKTTGPKPVLGVAWTLSGRATSPVIADNTLYIAHDGEVDAYNPATGAMLWSSADSSAGGTIGGIHWEYPSVSGNWLLMTDGDGMLFAYRRS